MRGAIEPAPMGLTLAIRASMGGAPEVLLDRLLNVGGGRMEMLLGKHAQHLHREREDHLFGGESGEPLLGGEDTEHLLGGEPGESLSTSIASTSFWNIS